MDDKITLDKSTLKALVVDSRLDILKLLNAKKYTQSEISDLLSLSKPTVKEHLKILVDAKLIKKEDTKRKWKYYSITFKGKRIVDPRGVQVLFAFMINFAIFAFTSLVSIKKFLFLSSAGAIADSTNFAANSAVTLTDIEMAAEAAPRAMMMATEKVAENMSNVTAALPSTTSTLPPWTLYIAVVIIFGLISSFLLGLYSKKKVVIIKG